MEEQKKWEKNWPGTELNLANSELKFSMILF